MVTPEPRPRRSQVSLTTVFTVCFGVLAVVALVFFLLKTRVALTLSLGSALAAVAMDHAVDALFLVEFMGVVGAVVAVPVAAAAQIVAAEIVTIRREQARQHENTGRLG